MTVQSTLVRISTGEIIKRGILPTDPSQAVPGLDPDLKWLIDYEPFGVPQYDSRIFILQKTEAVTETEHPDYPLYSQYLVTYATERRVVDEIKEAIVNRERVEFGKQIDYMDKLAMLGLTILFRQLEGLQLNATERKIKNRITDTGIKIYKNHQRREQLEAEAESIEPLDIDGGWETVDDGTPI